MENGSTLQPSGIKVQSVFLPLLPQSAGCSILFYSRARGTDRQRCLLLRAPNPLSQATIYGRQSLRPSCMTLVMQSLLLAIAVAVAVDAKTSAQGGQLIDGLGLSALFRLLLIKRAVLV